MVWMVWSLLDTCRYMCHSSYVFFVRGCHGKIISRGQFNFGSCIDDLLGCHPSGKKTHPVSPWGSERFGLPGMMYFPKWGAIWNPIESSKSQGKILNKKFTSGSPVAWNKCHGSHNGFLGRGVDPQMIHTICTTMYLLSLLYTLPKFWHSPGKGTGPL